MLHAYDATNLATELYNSNQAANSRDPFGAGSKFIAPAVAHGKLVMGDVPLPADTPDLSRKADMLGGLSFKALIYKGMSHWHGACTPLRQHNLGSRSCTRFRMYPLHWRS